MSVSTVSSTPGDCKSLLLDDTNFHRHRPASLARHSVYRFPVPVDDQLDAVVIDAAIPSTSSNRNANDDVRDASSPNDDVFDAPEHVYANLVELEAINRRPVPPAPEPDEAPIRHMPNGWDEYRTRGGRSYFYCPETGVCQWKPPRMLLSAAQVNLLMLNRRASEDNGTASTMKPSQVAATLDSPTVTPPTPRRDKERNPEDQDVQCNDYLDTTVALATMDDLRPESPPVEIAPSKPPSSGTIHEAAPPGSANSSPEMVNSVDSGISRGSISYRNQGYGLSRPPIIHHHNLILDSGNGTDPVHNSPGAALAAQSFESLVSCIPGARCSTNFSQKTIKSGMLEKCKITEGGQKLKKREWGQCFVFLSSAHLIFYKDERSAERHGKHYSAPLGMCDLRGARLMWAEKDKVKDKRRKHVFLLELAEGTEFLFSSAMPNDINGWFHALRQVISKLPQAELYPAPVCVFDSSSAAVLQRNGSSVSFRAAPSTVSNSPFSLKNFRHSTKVPVKCTPTKVDPMSSSMIEATSSNSVDQIPCSDQHQPPSRESIIERLKRFFRTRPSVESLREKGIYRPEPVFGSTLQTICTHECSRVPKFIRVVTEVIEAKGLDTDGLYRVSGNLSSVQKIRCRVDQDDYRELLKEEDVHVLTGALKLFFRELSEPLFPLSMAKEFMNAIKLVNAKQKFKAIDDLLMRLPLVNRETLKALLRHLQKVANHSDQNRMQIHSLAIMFGPTLFSCDHRSASQRFNSGEKKKRKNAANEPPPAQPSQNLAFIMIQQGQVVEYILQELNKFTFMKSQ
uniref:Rho-GAP domain-containing protein n=1 Tax=Steinernema glaseri TaxID=37863 RepID=A0A1I7Y8B8_9BILA